MGSPTIAALFAQRVVVGVGDIGASNNPSITLSTYALGSCIAVVAYDPDARAGGLLHMMLPDSTISKDKAAAQPAMFADTGLPVLFRSLTGFRADVLRCRIMLAGGASVLGGTDMFKIGERNLKATMDILNRAGMRVRHSIVGGTTNRTVHLNIADGGVTVKMPEGTQNFSLA